MPLLFANINEDLTIKNVSGNKDTKHHLESLGFVCGNVIRIISKNNQNVIVLIKGSRIALSGQLANKIYI